MKYLFVLLVSSVFTFAASNQAQYVITNNDSITQNASTFYSVSGPVNAPILTELASVKTHGQGLGTGFASAVGVTLVKNGNDECIFAADSGSSDVASILLSSQKFVGKFAGSAQDNGGFDGVGLAANSKYLYASYTGNYSLATYKIESGCRLKFLKDVDSVGKNIGMQAGMAVHGNTLIATYQDGSIQSFDISKGVPTYNGDLQFSTGYTQDGTSPFGVIITKDGHYAVFGDSSIHTFIEVSDISSGKLTATVVYPFAAGGSDSNNVLLSPSEKFLYVSNNTGGTVTALHFDNKKGAVTMGCVSPVLKGFGKGWLFSAGVANGGTVGTGDSILVSEFGYTPGQIGILKFRSSSNGCTLKETANSPVSVPHSDSLRSIQTYP
jgi:hypothetical protein